MPPVITLSKISSAMIKLHSRLFEVTGLFFFSLFLFTWGLSSQEVIGFDSRFYLFAQEMSRNGLSWFPTTYDHPYPDYPASAILLIYLLGDLFGTLNKFIAVLPDRLHGCVDGIFHLFNRRTA